MHVTFLTVDWPSLDLLGLIQNKTSYGASYLCSATYHGDETQSSLEKLKSLLKLNLNFS